MPNTFLSRADMESVINSGGTVDFNRKSYSKIVDLPTQAELDNHNSGYKDYSGSITASNVSQNCMPANQRRKYLFVQNQGTVDLWLSLGDSPAVAGQPSIRIPTQGWFEPSIAPKGAIKLLSSQSGLAFTAKEG